MKLKPRYASIIVGLLATLSLGVPGSAVLAQTATPDPAARYPLPTFEENWQFLSDPSRRSDPWDLVKFIGLGKRQSTFLSLGGEARETYERFGNQDFGLSTPSPKGYWLQRYLLHADLHVGSRLRVWGETSSSLESGRKGGARPIIDEDRLDLHQAFAEAGLLQRPDVRVRLRAGRQEIMLGSGRMYALREGVNVPFSLDGARLTAQTPRWRVDTWAARPVVNSPGVFEDRSRRGFSVWGIYASRPAGVHLTLDAYYLGLDRNGARFDQGVGHERRHSLGVRAWHPGIWSFDAETIVQIGRFGAGDIRAWRLAADGSHTLSTLAWRPRLGLDVDVASGNRNVADKDLQTFNAMFQSGIYSGRAQLLGPNNSIRFEPSLGLTPARHLTISGGWGFYWRQSDQDGLYGIPGQLIVPSNGVPGHYEGSRPIAQVDWMLTPHLSMHLNYIYVFNARFEERSVHGTPTMSYVSPWITYRF